MKKYSDTWYQAYELFFGTLANKNRLLIINALRKKPLNVTEISKYTKLSQTLISHNLRKLEHCGFVSKRVEGKFRYYSLNNKTLGPLMDMIDKHMKQYCHKIVLGKR